MRYVQRTDGVISGSFANRQPGFAEEAMAESNPEYVAWIISQLPPTTIDGIYDKLLKEARLLRAVVLALNDGSLPIATNKTAAQLKAIIKAKING